MILEDKWLLFHCRDDSRILKWFSQFIPLYLLGQNCGINKIIRYLKCVVLWDLCMYYEEIIPIELIFLLLLWGTYIYIVKPSRQYYDYLIFIYIYSYTYFFLIILSLWDYFPSVCRRLLFHFFFLLFLREFNSARNKLYQYWFVWKLYFILVLEEFSLEIRFPPNTWETILLFSGFVL